LYFYIFAKQHLLHHHGIYYRAVIFWFFFSKYLLHTGQKWNYFHRPSFHMQMKERDKKKLYKLWHSWSHSFFSFLFFFHFTLWHIFLFAHSKNKTIIIYGLKGSQWEMWQPVLLHSRQTLVPNLVVKYSDIKGVSF
jgi:hypothetical protein